MLIDAVVNASFTRPPTDDERKLLERYLKDRTDRPVEGIRQIVWALLTSSEFRFNY
jgi:hypothetical protein